VGKKSLDFGVGINWDSEESDLHCLVSSSWSRRSFSLTSQVFTLEIRANSHRLCFYSCQSFLRYLYLYWVILSGILSCAWCDAIYVNYLIGISLFYVVSLYINLSTVGLSTYFAQSPTKWHCRPYFIGQLTRHLLRFVRRHPLVWPRPSLLSICSKFDPSNPSFPGNTPQKLKSPPTKITFHHHYSQPPRQPPPSKMGVRLFFKLTLSLRTTLFLIRLKIRTFFLSKPKLDSEALERVE